MILSLCTLTACEVSLPTNSKRNKLIVASYGDFTAKSMEITLKCKLRDNEFVHYVLNIQNGVHTAEPQDYRLPDLPNGIITINVKIESYTNKLNQDVVKFYDASILKKRGLLIYLGNLQGDNVYISSGNKVVCYTKDSAGTWVPLLDYNGPVSFAEGGGGEIIPHQCDWKSNEWVKYDS